MKNLLLKLGVQLHPTGRKRPLLMLAVLFLLISTAGRAQVLFGWDGSTVSSWGPASWAATTTNTNLSIGNLNKGSGISNGSTAASFGWGGVNWQGTSTEDASFTVTPNAGHQVSFSALNLNYRRSNTGPTGGTIDYTIGGSTTFSNLATVSFGNSSSGGSIPAVNLSGIAALQNVQPGTVVKFRILPSGGGTAGTWYIYNSPGLTLSGSISAAIPPFYGAITQSDFIQCAGDASAVLTTSITGGTRPYTYSWSPSGGNDSTATGLTAGSYSCFVADAGSTHTAIATYTVGEPTALVTSISSQSVQCFAGSTGNASVTATGGIAPYTYSWMPTGGTNNVEVNLAAGIYTVITSDAHACNNTATVEVTQPATAPAIMASASSMSVCDGSTVALTGAGASSYTWTSGVMDGVAFTPTATMTYSVAGTTTSGCDGFATITVTVNSNPTITVNSGAICPGGVFTLSPGGASTYTFSNGSATVAPTALTSYSVYGTSAEGCDALAPAVSSVNAVTTLTVSISGSQIICNGQSDMLTANGAASYTWSTGGGTSYTVAPTPTSNTTYSVLGVSGTCSGSAAINVTVMASPTVSIAGPAVSCYAAAITLTASGANTYQWSDGSATATVAASPTANVSYSVVGTGTNGCAVTAVQNITVNPNPTITVSGATICAGTLYTFSPSGADTYTFSGGSDIVTPTVTTTYSVTGTNSLGCSTPNTTTVTLTVKVSPTISVNSGAICLGDDFTLTPSSSGSFTFQNGGPVVTPTISTNYTVSSTNSIGCTASAIAAVTVAPYPTIIASDGTVCAGSVYSINPTGATSYTFSNGSNTVIPTGTSTYSITGDSYGCAATNTAVVNVSLVAVPVLTVANGSICNGATFTIIPQGASTYTYFGVNTGTTVVSGTSTAVNPTATTVYTVTGTSTLGCNASAQTTVTILSAPSITLSSTAICMGDSYTFTPTGADTYTFAPGGPVVTPTSTTSYSVVGTNTNTGCSSASAVVATITVNAIPSVTVAPSTTAVCSGGNMTLTTSGAANYSVNGSSITGSTTVINPTATVVYTLTGETNGCIDTLMFNANVHALPTITVPAGVICSGASYTLTASGASTYSFSSGPVVSPTVTTTYTVTGTDVSGCVSTMTTAVTLTNAIVVSVAGNTLICGGQADTLMASGASTYSWSTGVSTSTAAVSPTAASAYTVNGTSASCTASAVITVSVMAGPSISVAASSTAVCTGQSVTLNATGAGSLTWAGGITNNTAFTPTATAAYSVSGTGTNGCVGHVITNIVVNNLPNLIASAISPTICSGTSGTLTAGGATSYSWSGNAATTTTITVSPTVSTTYTVTGTDASGCSKTTTVTQAVMICTGIGAQSADAVALIAYPNPNNGSFAIRTSAAASLMLVNELGQVVRTIRADVNETEVKDLNPGIYFLTGSDKSTTIKQKIVVTR